MSYRTTLGLLLLVLALGVTTWVMHRNVESTQRRHARETEVLDIDLLNVDAMVVQKGDMEIAVERRTDAWWIVRPIEAPAKEAHIGRLLSTSEMLQCVETITREQRQQRALSLGDYGLDLPRTSVTYRTPRTMRRLLIGNNARLGGRAYVRIDGQSNVMLAEGGMRDALPDSLEDMRDRDVLPGRPARVTRMELDRREGGFVQLLRGPTGWVLQQPVRDPADGMAVAQLLNALFEARIATFVWDPPRAGADGAVEALPVVKAPLTPVESYGLASDTAPAKVRIWQSDDEAGRELTLGKPVDEDGNTVYAMMTDGGSVFTLNKRLLDQCQVPVNDLRSRKLIRLNPSQVRYLAVQQGDRKLVLGRLPRQGWSVLEPIQWAADRETVVAVLRTLTEARIRSFGEAEATNSVPAPDEAAQALHLVLATAYPPGVEDGEAGAASNASGSPDGHVERCELTARENGWDDRMTVSVVGRPGRFRVRRDALVFLPEADRLPLAFFDRTVLAVAPDHVKRVTLRRGEFERVVARDAEGRWTVLHADAVRPDARVLSDLLFDLSNLRAGRVADHAPASLTPYGLEQVEDSLTINLSGSDAIQKTILFGAPVTGDGTGRFAIIQGQDVVFVIEPSVAAGLLRDPVIPISTPAEQSAL